MLALERYGAIVADRPRDMLALMVAHALDFRMARWEMLRDRIASVLPHWHAGMRGYASVLAMYAFGLEENGYLHSHRRSHEVGSTNGSDRPVAMNTGVALAALVLGATSLTLFVFSVRRLLNRQSEVVVSMLQRYDDRLATFAQSLNDTLTSLPAHDAPTLDVGDDAEPVMRTLELAVAQTSADGAVALVTGSSGAPVVATIGLSEAETHHIARMGFPDYRGARAIEVAFSGDIDAPDGSPAIRAGLRPSSPRRGRATQPSQRVDPGREATIQ